MSQSETSECVFFSWGKRPLLVVAQHDEYLELSSAPLQVASWLRFSSTGGLLVQYSTMSFLECCWEGRLLDGKTRGFHGCLVDVCAKRDCVER